MLPILEERVSSRPGEDVDELLRRACRGDDVTVARAWDTTAADAVWRAVQTRITAERETEREVLLARRRADGLRPAGRHRRRAGVVLAVALAAAVGTAGTAAATAWWSARTGRHLPADGPEAPPPGGEGELIRTDGSDFLAVGRDLARDIPFPSPAQRDAAIRRLQRHGSGGTGAVASETAIRSSLTNVAVCRWGATWLGAGAAPERDRATRALTGALSWPSVLKIDPHPHPPTAPDMRGGEGAGQYGWLAVMAQAARRGDTATMTEVTAEHCDPQLLAGAG